MINKALNKVYIAIGFITLVLSGCGEAPVQETKELVRPVKLIDISVASNIKKYSFPAVVEAADTRELAFEVSGQLQQLYVREGQEVKQGQAIALLKQRNFNNQLNTAQSQFDSAKIEFNRVQQLVKQKVVSQSEFEQKKTQFEVARAQLDTAKKALEDTKLVAPFSGIIAVKHVEQSATVSPSTPIVTLQSVGSAEVLVKVPASLVSRSQQIEPIATTVTLDAAPEYKMPAQLASASTLADERSQTFNVRFSFTPVSDLVIFPGMTGQVHSSFKMASKQGASSQITVPIRAILSDSKGNFVWKVDPATMTVSRQNIELGKGVAESLLVTSGLSSGDVIVGAGTSYLSEGMKVRRLHK